MIKISLQLHIATHQLSHCIASDLNLRPAWWVLMDQWPVGAGEAGDVATPLHCLRLEWWYVCQDVAVQYSTLQYNKVQYRTVHYSTVQCWCGDMCVRMWQGLGNCGDLERKTPARRFSLIVLINPTCPPCPCSCPHPGLWHVDMLDTAQQSGNSDIHIC